MNKNDLVYLNLLKDVLENGKRKSNRTGTDVLSVFGRQVRYSLKEGFPLITTKKVSFHNIVVELLWFLSGRTDVLYLQDQKVKIWNEWANPEGELVNCYGKQWRRWEGLVEEKQDDDSLVIKKKYVDQIANVITEIKTNPNSRRLIVNSWNPGDLETASLAWCHSQFQFYVQDGELSCHLLQRSGDCFLGIPYNIASYALLTHMIAQVCDLKVGEFVHSITDLHLYENHIEQAKIQLTRTPFHSPTLKLNPSIQHIDQFIENDIKLEGYQSHSVIKAKIAV